MIVNLADGFVTPIPTFPAVPITKLPVDTSTLPSESIVSRFTELVVPSAVVLLALPSFNNPPSDEIYCIGLEVSATPESSSTKVPSVLPRTIARPPLTSKRYPVGFALVPMPTLPFSKIVSLFCSAPFESAKFISKPHPAFAPSLLIPTVPDTLSKSVCCENRNKVFVASSFVEFVSVATISLLSVTCNFLFGALVPMPTFPPL